ncbi:MAG TPA: lactate utilization protein C [Pirellulales bacterium]|nr:lactate utilization protein C [Pirellulales bacterium]
MKREEFLARVRSAAEAGRAYRVHADATIPNSAGYVGAGDDLPGQLAVEITAVGGQATVVDDLPAAREVLSTLIEQYRPKTALCWQHPVLERLAVDSFLAERGIARLTHDGLAALPPNEQRQRILAADIGITSVTFAIAETGSLVMMSEPGRERLASLLPPVHVAIVERSQILPDLFDLFTEVQRAGYENLPSNLAFITGPSKTGDVEFTLTTGVHGPGKWHVIVVRA